MNESDRCPYCLQSTHVVWVHGHGQCAVCKINIDECCRGEQCAPVPGGRRKADG